MPTVLEPTGADRHALKRLRRGAAASATDPGPAVAVGAWGAPRRRVAAETAPRLGAAGGLDLTELAEDRAGEVRMPVILIAEIDAVQDRTQVLYEQATAPDLRPGSRLSIPWRGILDRHRHRHRHRHPDRLTICSAWVREAGLAPRSTSPAPPNGTAGHQRPRPGRSLRLALSLLSRVAPELRFDSWPVHCIPRAVADQRP